MQWHHARIIAGAARSLCSERPLLSQIEKLIPDNQVISQSGFTWPRNRAERASDAGRRDAGVTAPAARARARAARLRLRARWPEDTEKLRYLFTRLGRRAGMPFFIHPH